MIEEYEIVKTGANTILVKKVAHHEDYSNRKIIDITSDFEFYYGTCYNEVNLEQHGTILKWYTKFGSKEEVFVSQSLDDVEIRVQNAMKKGCLG